MGKIRIIGGIHRSRQLNVLDSDGLRPTLDRVKETLFNWLGQDLTGLTCLDLFAGSGSLGFESLSRNAKNVIMVEKKHSVYNQLQTNVKLLNIQNCQIVNADGIDYLRKTTTLFDVVFLDPPYDSCLLIEALTIAKDKLTPNGVVYAEYRGEQEFIGYEIFKNGKAGVVNYVLLRIKGN